MSSALYPPMVRWYLADEVSFILNPELDGVVLSADARSSRLIGRPELAS